MAKRIFTRDNIVPGFKFTCEKVRPIYTVLSIQSETRCTVGWKSDSGETKISQRTDALLKHLNSGKWHAVVTFDVLPNVGQKVIRGIDWSHGDQDNNSVYGVITNIRAVPKADRPWVSVAWKNKAGITLHENNYKIGGKNGLSLYSDSRPDNHTLSEEYDLYYCLEGEDISEGTISHYELIKEYPGAPSSRKAYLNCVGKWFSETDGNGGDPIDSPEKYPEFWKPVYLETTKKVEITHSKGESVFIEVEKDSPMVFMGGRGKVNIKDIEKLKKAIDSINRMEIFGHSISISQFSVGCHSDISIEYLHDVIDAWKSMNNKS